MILLTCMQSSLTLALPEQPTWCRSSARRKALAFAKHGGNPILFRSPELTASLDPPSVPASGGIPPPLPPTPLSPSFPIGCLPAFFWPSRVRARIRVDEPLSAGFPLACSAPGPFRVWFLRERSALSRVSLFPLLSCLLTFGAWRAAPTSDSPLAAPR